MCALAAVSPILPAYEPTPENLAARARFQDARFGMFVHWGVYSVLGDGEWVMHTRKMPVADYEKLPPQFNPTGYDPESWVRLAKRAGMRYLTFTSKHHDGFALWPTKQNRWNVVDSTPYGQDVLGKLAAACSKEDLPLFLYHSHLDWHHTDYYPRGRTGQHSGRPEAGDFQRYLDFMDEQLRELLTGYGPIAGIWFDGMWDKPDADWRLSRTYELIHQLQPGALIGNNHHLAPYPGEDFQMFEKDLPGQNRSGYSGEATIGKLPLETCETINTSWGYNTADKQFKSTRELVHLLARAAGHSANLLLNVGPAADGSLQPELVARLEEIGTWLERYGDSIYATRGGPIPPRPWGVSTQTSSRVFIHVLDWQDAWLAIPEVKGLRNPRFLGSGRPVTTVPLAGALAIHLPEEERDEWDTVIVFER